MKHARAARIVLALVVCSSALLMMTATSYGAPALDHITPPPCPTGEVWDPIMHRCVAISYPCPAGTIDINGNGKNDGGDDCQSLDVITVPNNCIAWPSPGALEAEGDVTCALPWSLGGVPMTLLGATGCLDITRTPYPRAMVGVPTTFEIKGLFDGVATIPDELPGGYRLSSVPWATEGLYLHERYLSLSYDSLGRPAFNTEALLGSDLFKYPSLNNIRAYLLFQMASDPSQIIWTTDGFSASQTGGLPGTPVELEHGYQRSSFPRSGYEFQFSNYGPNRYGQNVLSAFKVRVSTGWQLYFVSEWDPYSVDANNAYVRGSHQVSIAPLGLYASYRVWDGRQALSPGMETIYCNAQDGYLPVPVLEAQSVLKQ